MVNNDNHENNDNYSNSDNTAEANNDNAITNGSATSPAGVMVLRLASGDNSRRRSGRSPTAAAAAGVSLRSGGGVRRGILKRPTTRTSTSHTISSDEAPYVPAPVPEIIANVEDVRIPVERDSDLTAEERAAKIQALPATACPRRLGRIQVLPGNAGQCGQSVIKGERCGRDWHQTDRTLASASPRGGQRQIGQFYAVHPPRHGRRRVR